MQRNVYLWAGGNKPHGKPDEYSFHSHSVFFAVSSGT